MECWPARIATRSVAGGSTGVLRFVRIAPRYRWVGSACRAAATDLSSGFQPWVCCLIVVSPESTSNPAADAGCNSKLAHCYNTPTLRVAGFEDEDDDDDEDEKEAPYETWRL